MLPVVPVVQEEGVTHSHFSLLFSGSQPLYYLYYYYYYTTTNYIQYKEIDEKEEIQLMYYCCIFVVQLISVSMLFFTPFLTCLLALDA